MKYIGSLLMLLAVAVEVLPQPPAKHPGILLFEEGHYAESVRSLETAVKSKTEKRNAGLWNYLGLAQLRSKDKKRARKSFQQAVKIAPTSGVYRANLAYAYILNGQRNKAISEAEKAISLDDKATIAYTVRGFSSLIKGDLDGAEGDAAKMIEMDPALADGYKLKADVIMARLERKLNAGSAIRDEVSLFKTALEVIEEGVRQTARRDGNAVLVYEREELLTYVEAYSKPLPATQGVPVKEPGVEPARILYKEPAPYTTKARDARTKGRIRIALILGADGRIRRPILMDRLGNGLDENALAAAMQIKFQPKTVNGKPVSAVIAIEYSFDIYLRPEPHLPDLNDAAKVFGRCELRNLDARIIQR